MSKLKIRSCNSLTGEEILKLNEQLKLNESKLADSKNTSLVRKIKKGSQLSQSRHQKSNSDLLNIRRTKGSLPSSGKFKAKGQPRKSQQKSELELSSFIKLSKKRQNSINLNTIASITSEKQLAAITEKLIRKSSKYIKQSEQTMAACDQLSAYPNITVNARQVMQIKKNLICTVLKDREAEPEITTTKELEQLSKLVDLQDKNRWGVAKIKNLVIDLSAELAYLLDQLVEQEETLSPKDRQILQSLRRMDLSRLDRNRLDVKEIEILASKFRGQKRFAAVDQLITKLEYELKGNELVRLKLVGILQGYDAKVGDNELARVFEEQKFEKSVIDGFKKELQSQELKRQISKRKNKYMSLCMEKVDEESAQSYFKGKTPSQRKQFYKRLIKKERAPQHHKLFDMLQLEVKMNRNLFEEEVMNISTYESALDGLPYAYLFQNQPLNSHKGHSLDDLGDEYDFLFNGMFLLQDRSKADEKERKVSRSRAKAFRKKRADAGDVMLRMHQNSIYRPFY